MSNSLAIAAVTNTLQKMLTSSTIGVLAKLPSDLADNLNLSNLSVTTRPLDRARPTGADNKNQLNLFLYQTLPNAAWRNLDMPRQRPGETASPPVALTLHYLLSVYPSNDDDTAAHVLLGQAMRVFQDHAVLDRENIRGALAGNDLFEQVESVRISPLSLSLEEISKLWTAFATNYRVSAAYEVSVVLIDSSLPGRSPMPVLSRGPADRGAGVQTGGNLPVLEKIELPNSQGSALLEDALTLRGENLEGISAVRLSLANPRLPEFQPILLVPPDVKSEEGAIKGTVRTRPAPANPGDPPPWVAGFYKVAVLVNRTVNEQAQTWSSNELPLALAPRIVAIDGGNVFHPDADDNVVLTLSCEPAVRLAARDPATDTEHLRFGQQALLVLVPLAGTGVRQIPAQPPGLPGGGAPPPASVDRLTFNFHVSASELGEYWVRLRVDGVDLPGVDRTVSPPVFSQKIRIQ